jgi:hypothetical protein
MPERGLALTFGALLIIGIAVVFGFTGTKSGEVRNFLLGRGNTVTTPAPAPVPQPEPARSSAVRRKVRRPEPVQTAVQQPPAVVLEIPVQLPKPVRGSDVRPSMTRTEVVQRLGAPDLQALWSDNGKINEKLYYQRPETLELEVLVQNGRVVSSRNAN